MASMGLDFQDTYIITGRVRGSVVPVDFTRVGGEYHRCGITLWWREDEKRMFWRRIAGNEFIWAGIFAKYGTFYHGIILSCCLAFGELRAFQKIVSRCHDNLAWGQSNESI